MISLSVPTGRKLKSGKWNIELMINGRKVSITKDTAQEAQIEAFILKLSERYKRNIEGRVVPSSEPLTLRDAINNYINDRRSILSPSTIRGYEKIRDTRFKDIMDKNVLSVANWQAVINDESAIVSPKTVNNAMGLVRSALAYSGIEVPKLRMPKAKKIEHPFLEPDKIEIFINAIRGHKNELAMLLGLHGLRRSEIYAITKSDLKDGFINVHAAIVQGSKGWVRKDNTKTYESTRKVPILIERVTELAFELNDDYNKCLHNPWIANVVNSICRKNGLPEVGLHGLRHTFASLCYHLGLSEMETMELGGWSDINVMRKIYTHLAKSDRKDAADKLKKFFE